MTNEVNRHPWLDSSGWLAAEWPAILPLARTETPFADADTAMACNGDSSDARRGIYFSLGNHMVEAIRLLPSVCAFGDLFEYIS